MYFILFAVSPVFTFLCKNCCFSCVSWISLLSYWPSGIISQYALLLTLNNYPWPTPGNCHLLHTVFAAVSSECAPQPYRTGGSTLKLFLFPSSVLFKSVLCDILDFKRQLCDAVCRNLLYFMISPPPNFIWLSCPHLVVYLPFSSFLKHSTWFSLKE